MNKKSDWLLAPDKPGPFWLWPRDSKKRLRASVQMQPIDGRLIVRIHGTDEFFFVADYLVANADHNRWRPRSLTPQPAPRWKQFMTGAVARMGRPEATVRGFAEQIARDLVAHKEGEAFLKAARRGRSTHRQNLRYLILREVEALMGDAVPRRRPDSNTPDAVALRVELTELGFKL